MLANTFLAPQTEEKNEKIKALTYPREVFDQGVVNFLIAISQRLQRHGSIKDYPDLASLAFWCRPANIEKLKIQFSRTSNKQNIYQGLGKVFHITPANVPLNFFYSLCFGLLAGNANTVRLPSRQSPQEKILLDVINELIKEKLFSSLRELISFVRYPSDDEQTTEGYSKNCDARVIWGGDSTIEKIRKFPIPARARDVAFADRYSFAMLDAKSVGHLNFSELNRFAENFYNDVYTLNQNACSSPHLIIWTNREDDSEKRFWSAFESIVRKRHSLNHSAAVSKFTQLLVGASEDFDGAEATLTSDQKQNHLYRIAVNKISPSLSALRIGNGAIYEFHIKQLDELNLLINEKFQTLCYFGVDIDSLKQWILKSNIRGIDRIVPVGQALDINTLWDGMDLIRQLSREISLR